MAQTRIIADRATIETPGIPFYATDVDKYGVVVKTSAATEADVLDEWSMYANYTARSFIAHYLPEYAEYLLTSGAGGTTGDDPAFFEELIKLISRNLALFRYTGGTLGNHKMTIMTTNTLDLSGTSLGTDISKYGLSKLDFLKLREFLSSKGWPGLTANAAAAARGLSVILPGLDAFGALRPGGSANMHLTDNAIKGYPYTSSQSFGVIYLDTIRRDTERFADLMENFHQQLQNFPGSVNHPINFLFLKRAVPSFIKRRLLPNIYETINIKGTGAPFDQGDYTRLDFDNHEQLVSIVYYSPGNNQGSLNSNFAKIGYYTTIEHTQILNDPIFVNILKNFNSILADISSYRSSNAQYSFLQFLASYFPESDQAQFAEGHIALDTPTLPDPAALQSESYSFGNAETTINATNYAALVEQFSNTLALNREEVNQIMAGTNNEEFLVRTYQQEKNRQINIGLNIAATADRILANKPVTGFTSMTGLGGNQSREQQVLNLILSQIGIDQLAMEALICFTYGMNFEAGRFSNAVRSAIEAHAGSIFSPPPKPQFPSRPSRWEDKDYYSTTGDPPMWKDILNLILTHIAGASHSIAEGLASLIKENCGDLLGDAVAPGQADLGQLVQDNIADLDLPNLDNIVDSIFDNIGHFPTPGQGYDYLRDLSAILTVPELCRLFYSQEDVSNDLLDRILEFNSTYGLWSVRTHLDTYSAVLSFFYELAQVVDFREYCDTWAEQLIPIAQTCCLTEGALLDALGEDNLKNILDILEGIIEFDPTDLNFICPERANFISSSVYNNTIPSVFDMFVTPLHMEFAYAAQGAKKQLLDEEVVMNRVNSFTDIIDLIPLSPENLLTTEELPDPGRLGPIASLFENLPEPIAMISASYTCPIDFSKFGNVSRSEIATTAVSMFGAGAVASSPAGQMYGSVYDKITELRETLEQPPQIPGLPFGMPTDHALSGVPYSSYVFPQDYLNILQRYFPIGGYYAGALSEYNSLELEYAAYSEPGSSNLYTYAVNDKNQNRNFRHHGYWRQMHSGDPETMRFRGLKLNFYAPPGQLADFIEIHYQKKSAFGGGYYLDIPAGFSGADQAQSIPVESDIGYWAATGDPNAPDLSEFHRDMNSCIANFVVPVMTRLEEAFYNEAPEIVFSDPRVFERNALRERLGTNYFASAMSGMTKNALDYILENGIFTADGINNLKFFKNNDLCNPQNIGDLVDADGITNQILVEFLESACHDNIPLPDKVKNALRYGLYNLLAQLFVVEFLVKNVSMLGAFDAAALLRADTGLGMIFRKMMVNSINSRLSEFLSAVGGDIYKNKQNMATLFNLKLQRQVELQNYPYIPFTDSALASTLTPADGIKFSAQDSDIERILAYIVEERLTYQWREGAADPGAPLLAPNRSTLASINNVLNFNTSANSWTATAPGTAGGTSRVFWEKAILWSEPYLGQLSSDRIFPGLFPSAIPNLDDAPAAFEYGFFVVEKHIAWEEATGDLTPWEPPWAPPGGVLENAPHHGSHHYLPGALFRSLTINRPGIDFKAVKALYKLVYYFPIGPENSSGDDVNLDSLISYHYGARPGTEEEVDALQVLQIWKNGFQGVATAGNPRATAGRRTRFNSIYITDAEETLSGGSLISLQENLRLCPVEITSHLSPAQYSNAGFTNGNYSGPGGTYHTSPGRVAVDNLANPRGLDHDISMVMFSQKMSGFFTSSFDRDLVFLIPLLVNMSLVDRQYPGISKCFRAPKKTVLRFLKILDKNQTQESRDYSVPPTGPIAVNNSFAEEQLERDFDTSAQAFVLMALKEYGLSVLRGLVETTDPHVMLAKKIRDHTGTAFVAMSEAIQEQILLSRAANPDNNILQNLTGYDVIMMLLCTLDLEIDDLDQPGVGPDLELNARFHPVLSMEGVDFTGTGSGFLMCPPGPLGLLYCLLMALQQRPEESEEESNVEPDPPVNEC